MVSEVPTVSHEPLQAEASRPVERPGEVIARFINFTKHVLADESEDIDIEWEHQMNMLFGSEELERVTRNRKYRGIPGIKNDLTSAYENGGFPQLKATFIVRAIEHTKVAELGDACINAFKGVIDFS